MSFSIKTGEKGPIIKLTRGDYASFHINIKDASGAEYVLQDGDVVTFTVKKNTKTEDVLIQKTGQDVEIEHEDTAEMKYGTYVYDVQLTHANGRPDTFIGPSTFEITEEVTF